MAEAISYVPNQHNKISAIVDRVLFMNTIPEQWFQWILEAGLWHLRELKLDVWQDVISEVFPVTDRKTVVMPLPFVSWVKVGVKVGQYAVTLGVNDKLNTLPRVTPNTTDYVNGLLSQNLPNGLDFNSYGGYYFFNYNGASLQGMGGGFITKGSFKVSKVGQTTEILLDFDYPYDTLLVEYITDGFDPCGETIIDPNFADYVMKGMEFTWEEKKNPSRTEASIRRKGVDFADALRKVKARRNGLDPQTVLNMSRSAVRFTPKI